MSEQPSNNSSDDESLNWRSKKYSKLIDDDIIELSKKPLAEKDRYYVLKELDWRGLTEAAKQSKLDDTKQQMRNKQWWKYIPLLFALIFLIKNLVGK
jgi:hypothetical protein